MSGSDYILIHQQRVIDLDGFDLQNGGTREGDPEGIAWNGGSKFTFVREQVGVFHEFLIDSDGADVDSVIDGDTDSDGLTDFYELADVGSEMTAVTLSPNPAQFDNASIEGITYDQVNDRYFVVKESSWQDLDSANGTEIVYEVSSSGVTTPVHIAGLTSDLSGQDASDVFYSSGHIFVLTEAGTNQLSRASFNTGTGNWSFSASNGADKFTFVDGSQPEGLTFSQNGFEMFIVNENRSFDHYRNFTSYEPARPVLVGSSVDTSVGIRITAPEGSYIAVFEDGETTPIATHKLDYGDTSHVFSLTGLDPGWQEITYKLATDSSSTSDKFSPQSEPLPRVDFNSDDQLDADDIDILFAAIDLESSDPTFDLNGDAALDSLDVDELVERILGTNYGDADLDRDVDGADLDIWVTHKFTADVNWADGNFNGVDECDNLDVTTCEGVVDGSDFNLWNANKLTTAVAAAAAYAEGDVNFDGVLDVADIDTMFAMKNLYNTDTTYYAGLIGIYDLDGDSALDWDDIAYIVFDVFDTVFGDLDLDGDVDDDDADILDENWQEYVDSWGLGDLNGDGFVNFSDFQQLANNYGYGT